MSGKVPGPRQQWTAGSTVEIVVGGEAGVMTTGYAPDGALCRVDLRAGVHGSAIAGLADALATAITLGLQHGAPPAEYGRVLSLALDRAADGDDGPGRLVRAAIAGVDG
nr:hypothetical protein GCM10020063_009680 [Dactylosporangium thailandense]